MGGVENQILALEGKILEMQREIAAIREAVGASESFQGPRANQIFIVEQKLEMLESEFSQWENHIPTRK